MKAQLCLLAAFSILFSALTQIAFAGDTLKMKTGNYRTSALRFDGEHPALLMRTQAKDTQKRTYVVQFKNHVSEADKTSLRSMGVEPKAYLPEDALVIKASLRELDSISLLPGVHSIVPFENEWKTNPGLIQTTGETLTELFVITTFDTTETKAIVTQLRSIPGTRIKMNRDRTIVLTSDRSRLGEMVMIDGIEWIEPMPIMVTFDFNPSGDPVPNPAPVPTPTPSASPSPLPPPPPLNGYESGARVMNFETAWSRGFHGENQIAAMADTGMDTGKLETIGKDLTGVLKGFPLGFGADSWGDSNGHGTHVSGSVIGNGTNSNGIIKGGAHAAHFVAVGLWSPIMDNLMFKQDYNELMGLPYKEGARIHTNSWGSSQNLGAYDANASKVDEFMWNNPDMLILFAAGNAGEDANQDGRIDEGSVSSPGTAKNVLTVGASENLLAVGGIQKKLGDLRGGATKWGVEPLKSDTLSNNINGMACFSSRGPTQDGRLKPEIVAPGTNIVSVRSQNPKAGTLWGAYNEFYAYSGGTSMATPLAAGAATVVRQYLTEGLKMESPSSALIKAVMMHTAFDMYPGQYGEGPAQELPTHRPNVHEGYGRVDMDFATNLSDASITDEKVGVALNESKTVKYQARAGQKLMATLVYTDFAGSASAAKALVNDLSLEVTAPSGEVITRNDHINNNKTVDIADTQSGEYSVKVTGVNVPQGKNGKQPFALVITAR